MTKNRLLRVCIVVAMSFFLLAGNISVFAQTDSGIAGTESVFQTDRNSSDAEATPELNEDHSVNNESSITGSSEDGSLVNVQEVIYEDINNIKGNSQSEDAVLYFIPHQDDETLTFGYAIIEDLANGKDVHVVLITDGSKSLARERINKSDKLIDKKPLTEDEFSKARDREITAALTQLGVKQENIHIPSTRIVDGTGSTSGVVIRDMMTKYLAAFPNATVKTFYQTMNEIDRKVHPDHISLGNMAGTLYDEKKINKLYCFIEPYFKKEFDDAFPDTYMSVGTSPSEEAAKKMELACAEYYKWDYENGRYAIGATSVDGYFAFIKANPGNWYYEYKSENGHRYGGATRYNTSQEACKGLDSRGNVNANFKGVSFVNVNNYKSTDTLPDFTVTSLQTKAAIFSDNVVMAPCGGRGISEKSEGNASNVGGMVVVTSGENFPDALASSSLGCQIILTKSTSLSPEAKAEILRTMPSRIVIMGGKDAVKPAVETAIINIAANTTATELKALTGVSRTDMRLVYKPSVVRCAGASRYDTAIAVTKSFGYKSTTNSVIITSGQSFADAVSIAPYAAKTRTPIILCDKSKLTKNSVVLLESLKEQGCERAIVVGGKGSVPLAAETQIKDAGIYNVERLAGSTRYMTSIEIARFSINDNVGINCDKPSFAAGDSFPDALVAGPITANNSSVILLVDPGVSQANRKKILSLVDEYKESKKENETGYSIFGGLGVVSKNFENSVRMVINK